MAKTIIADIHGQEHEYRTRPFSSSVGIEIGTKIGSIIGGPLGELFGGKETDGLLDANSGKLGDALSRALTKIDAKLFMRILATTERKRTIADSGKEVWEKVSEQMIFDHVYAANYPELLRAVIWVLGVNYGPFSGKNGGGWSSLFGGLSNLMMTQVED